LSVLEIENVGVPPLQLTVVETVWLVLLLVTGSVEDVETVATFTMDVLQVAEDETRKTTFTALDWPAVRLKLSQRTLDPFKWQELSEPDVWKVRLAGTTSARTTFVAVPGPAFVAVRVYVRVEPGTTVDCVVVFVMETSAVCALQVTVEFTT